MMVSVTIYVGPVSHEYQVLLAMCLSLKLRTTVNF
jgi:hypothetical protein